jgi:hypothetical protein
MKHCLQLIFWQLWFSDHWYAICNASLSATNINKIPSQTTSKQKNKHCTPDYLEQKNSFPLENSWSTCNPHKYVEILYYSFLKTWPHKCGEQTPETDNPPPIYKVIERNKYTIISTWLHFVSQMAGHPGKQQKWSVEKKVVSHKSKETSKQFGLRYFLHRL